METGNCSIYFLPWCFCRCLFFLVVPENKEEKYEGNHTGTNPGIELSFISASPVKKPLQSWQMSRVPGKEIYKMIWTTTTTTATLMWLIWTMNIYIYIYEWHEWQEVNHMNDNEGCQWHEQNGMDWNELNAWSTCMLWMSEIELDAGNWHECYGQRYTIWMTHTTEMSHMHALKSRNMCANEWHEWGLFHGWYHI